MDCLGGICLGYHVLQPESQSLHCDTSIQSPISGILCIHVIFVYLMCIMHIASYGLKLL